MKGKIKLFGKTMPAWLLAAGLIVASSGAATGVVLAGRVTGTITATVSQALRISFPATGTNITGADRSLITAKDDLTAFTAAAEINTGDEFDVNLALRNDSNAELTGELTLVAPDGITLSVDEAGDAVANIVRTGPFTWKFRLNPIVDPSTALDDTDLTITVALADDMLPGFYSIDGTLKQVAY